VIKAIIIFFCCCTHLFAEVVYLQNGMVLKGEIIKEDKTFITFQSSSKTQKILRSKIVRILFGARDLEAINILMNNGEILKGFLVDQDSEKIIFRKSKGTSSEQTIKKADIKQMSRDEIILLYPEVSLRSGLYVPLNGGLNPNLIFIAGYSIRFPWVNNSRVLFEVGFARVTSQLAATAVVQTIPFFLNYLYFYPVSKLSQSAFFGPASIVGKGGVGMTLINFDTGEGDTFQSLVYSFLVGLGLQYEITRNLLSVFMMNDYVFNLESGESLQTFSTTLGVSYRY